MLAGFISTSARLLTFSRPLSLNQLNVIIGREAIRASIILKICLNDLRRGRTRENTKISSITNSVADVSTTLTLGYSNPDKDLGLAQEYVGKTTTASYNEIAALIHSNNKVAPRIT